jgi:hypothetical protein
MTISTTDSRISYNGNSVTTVFSFPYRFLANGDIKVVSVSSTGVETVKTIASDYTLTGAGDDAGGSVTMLVAPVTGTRLIIYRDTGITQETDYISGDPFPAETHERALDRLTMIAQEIGSDADRAIKVPVGDSSSLNTTLPAALSRLDRLIAFDSSTGEMGMSTFTQTQIASAIAAAYAAGSTADAVTFLQSGTGAVSQTVQQVLRLGGVTPEQFGAVGDGTTDDQLALQRAINTGKNVYLSAGKTYRYTVAPSISTHFQRFGGPGVLKPDGNINGVLVTGGASGVELDVTFSSSTHTGTAVRIDNASRVRIRKLLGVDVGSILHVQQCNVCTVDWLWATARVKGITWYGTTAIRSDVLRIGFALFSHGAGQYGLDWDGNCHSLEVSYLGMVCGSSVSAGNAYGAIVRNTSGGTAPAIARITSMEIDYSGTHGFDITAGSDIDVSLPYIVGATGAGVRVGASINDYEVRIGGGKLRGNTTYGIQALGGVVKYSGNTDLSSNTTAETVGSVWTMTPRLAIDALHYLSNSSSNPLHTYDTGDYTSYDRTNNVLADFIGAAAVLSRSAARVTAGVPVRMPVYTVAGLPGVSVSGDTAFASNGRKAGEGAGSGTGVMVFSDGTAWRACDTGATVAA